MLPTRAKNSTTAINAGVKHARPDSNSSTMHSSKSTQKQAPSQAQGRQIVIAVEVPAFRPEAVPRGGLVAKAPIPTAVKPEDPGKTSKRQLALPIAKQHLSSTLFDTKAAGVGSRMEYGQHKKHKKQKHAEDLSTPERYHATTSGSLSSTKRQSGAMDIDLDVKGAPEHQQLEQHGRPEKKNKIDGTKVEVLVPTKPKEQKQPKEPDERDGPKEPKEREESEELNQQEEPEKLKEQEEPEEPKGREEPEEPKGREEPEEPKGREEPEEPKGREEPEEPKGREEPEEPDKRVDPEELQQQEEPEEPEEPKEQEPEEPKERAEPKEPHEGEEPKEPDEQEEPEELDEREEPEEPNEREQPEESNEREEPEEPHEREEPEEPHEREEPEEPHEREEPEEPHEREEPEEPHEREQPEESNEREEPEEPDEREQPEEPDEREQPEESNEREEPEEPHEREEPEEPHEREEPEELKEREKPQELKEPTILKEPEEQQERKEPTEPKKVRKEPESRISRQKPGPSTASTDSKDPLQPQKLKEGRSDGREPDSSIGSVKLETGSSSNSKKRPKSDTATLSEEDRYFLMHPDSVVGNTDLKDLINYQTYCAMPSATQDAFASLLPPEIFLDERLSIQGEDGTRRLAEAFFKNADWTHALETWVQGLQIGLQTATYQEAKQQMVAIAEEEDQWKSEAYEEYYGEHAAREIEAKLTASGSAKMSTARMGMLRGIRIGDQLRYQRSFKVPLVELGPDPAHQDHDGTDAKVGERRGRRVVKSTPRPSAKRERSVHVDMRLCVLGIKKDGTPIVQFVEVRAPADAEEPESAYQERLARSKDPKYGHEFVSVLDLEALCLERDGQVPESSRVPRQRKGSSSQPQKGAEEAWKDFDVIRSTVRVGSLFAVRMDLWVEEKNIKNRKDEAERERALAAEEAEISSQKPKGKAKDKAKGKGKDKAKAKGKK